MTYPIMGALFVTEKVSTGLVESQKNVLEIQKNCCCTAVLTLNFLATPLLIAKQILLRRENVNNLRKQQ